MTVEKIIYNEQGKVRTTIKLLTFVFLFQIIGVILLRTVIPFFQEQPFYLSFVVNVLSCIAVLLALWILAAYLEKNSLAQYGLGLGRKTATQFGLASLLGLTGIFLIVGFQWFGIDILFEPGTHFTGYNLILVYSTQFLRYLSGSVFEEILTTSFLFILVFNAVKPTSKAYAHRYFIAILVSALLFGFVHGLNENATILGVFNLLVFGALTTVNFARTRNIAFAVGFHCLWNFGQNIFFGLPNSGKPAEAWIFKTVLHSSDWITGGFFGLEGSIFTTVLLGSLLVYQVQRLRSKIYTI